LNPYSQILRDCYDGIIDVQEDAVFSWYTSHGALGTVHNRRRRFEWNEPFFYRARLAWTTSPLKSVLFDLFILFWSSSGCSIAGNEGMEYPAPGRFSAAVICRDPGNLRTAIFFSPRS
jgi:hypothetical protein